MTDAQIYALLYELDEIAREYDGMEYGLPPGKDVRERMRCAVLAALDHPSNGKDGK